MEQHKIDNFQKSNPGKAFPGYHQLSREQCSVLLVKISNKLGYKELPDSLTLVQDIEKTSCPIDSNALDKEFSLSNIFDSLSVVRGEQVYVNWYRFDEIDEINTCDLDKYFDDIWYPGSDDIDIFDSSLLWIVSVSHSGILSYITLER